MRNTSTFSNIWAIPRVTTRTKPNASLIELNQTLTQVFWFDCVQLPNLIERNL